MNRRIAEPLIINIIANTEKPKTVQDGRRLYVPLRAPWTDFTTAVSNAVKDSAYDSVIVHVDGAVPLEEKANMNAASIKINQICKAASAEDKAVLSDASNGIWYFMNPSWKEQAGARAYAPSDETVLEKFHSFPDEAAWQEHQSQVWERLSGMMPLSAKAGYGTPNHLAQLSDPKRGLGKEDVSGFWSFKPNRFLTPALMGDDMVGMPSVDGRTYDGFTIVSPGKDGVPVERPLAVMSLKTVGLPGIAIPMANVHGHVPKYQIATDPSKINISLKARTADGVSIARSEYFDKKTDCYRFQLSDGRESQLKVSFANEKGEIQFSDALGTFHTHMGEDLCPMLKERGYDLPQMVDTLKVTPLAKYIWQSRGTMVGSEDACKAVSPSNAGFLVAREPKNGALDYIVVVAEGALKGHIVSKYADVIDSEGNSFGDFIAKDRGIIVAQVPGVSHSFIESVKPVYEAYNVYGTYIAMDADGRENLAVANGIADAYESLSACSPVKVMSWDPAQKGLDDALLAVSRGDITLEGMGLKFGTPEKLFPKDQASAPNPYRLDGTRVNTEGWLDEYRKDAAAANTRLQGIQETTDPRVKAIQEELIHKAAEALKAQAGKKPEKKEVSPALAKRVEDLKKGSGDLEKGLPEPDKGKGKGDDGILA